MGPVVLSPLYGRRKLSALLGAHLDKQILPYSDVFQWRTVFDSITIHHYGKDVVKVYLRLADEWIEITEVLRGNAL